MKKIVEPKGIIISTLTAKSISNDWSGGFGSPLFQFGSNGIYLDKDFNKYIKEIDENISILKPSKQKTNLNKLKKYFKYKHFEANNK